MPTTSEMLAGQADTAAGGDAVPQSDTNTVARALLGDAAVDQFGDVIGARPVGVKDVLRDFAIGATQGLQGLEKIKGLQRKAYSDALFKQQQTALAQKKAEMAQTMQALDSYKKVQGLPAGQRASVLTSTLKSLGVTPDPAAIRLMLDGDIISQLPIEEIFEAAQRGDITMAQLQAVFGSAAGATNFISDMTRAVKDRQSVNSIALDILRKKQQGFQRARDISEEVTGLPQNVDPDIAANPERALARELAARKSGIHNEDQPMFPQFQGMSDEKLRKLATRPYRAKPKAAPKSAGGLEGLLQEGEGILGRGGSGSTPGGNTFRILPEEK